MHSGFWSARNTLTALSISKIATSLTDGAPYRRIECGFGHLLEQPARARTARYRLIGGDIAFLRQLIYTHTRARTAAPRFCIYGAGGRG